MRTRFIIWILFALSIPSLLSPLVFCEEVTENVEDQVVLPSLEKPLSEIIEDIKNPDPDVQASAFMALDQEGILWDGQHNRLRDGVKESEVRELVQLLIQMHQADKESFFIAPLTYMGPYAIDAFPLFLDLLKLEIPKMEQVGGSSEGFGVVIASGAIAQMGPGVVPLITEELKKSDGQLREILKGVLQQIQGNENQSKIDATIKSFEQDRKSISEFAQRLSDSSLDVRMAAAKSLEERWVDKVAFDPDGKPFFQYELPTVSGGGFLLNVSYDWKDWNQEFESSYLSPPEGSDDAAVYVLLAENNRKITITNPNTNMEVTTVRLPDAEDRESIIVVKSKKGHKIIFRFLWEGGLPADQQVLLQGVRVHPEWDPYWTS